jgi:predicted DNA binding CopG/RHH family protein
MAKPDELAKYYDGHDTSAEMESGHWVTEPPESDPMITTSLRLPKSLLDRVRTRAAEDDMKATAWIRALIEVSLSHSEPGSIEARVRRLEAAVFQESA